MSKRKPGGKALVIVESPAKARTINKYLGDDFVVKASMGHVRDLPQRNFGIDVDDNFRPTYELLRGRSKVVHELKRLADGAREVYLATDRDREGEAIAWHLAEALGLPIERARRVIFNEITKRAIEEAFEHPHTIDLDRVNAQQARRILDRIVGYELSPLLWRKIAKGLSAGRVQSVAVRLIVDRERELRNFVPEESWKVYAIFVGDPGARDRLRPEWAGFSRQQPSLKDTQRWLGQRGSFRAELVEVAGESFKAATAEEAARVAEALGYNLEQIARHAWEEYKHLGLKRAELAGRIDSDRLPTFTVSDLKTRRTSTKPAAPFTTASLQQAASTALRYSASRTMRIAQGLYEGIDLNGEGAVGLITYMRTDSTNLAAEAVAAARDYIQHEFGERYLPGQPNSYGKRQARAQEAHEAIRPTGVERTPESLRRVLSDEQYKLYELIWSRFVACQMTPAEWEATVVSVSCQTPLGPARFAGSGRKLLFDGYMRVAGVTSEDQLLPDVRVGQAVGLLDLEPKQQWTSPPPRFTEASLVKALESEGIGRPSTYATIIDTIQDRGYVEQVDRKFQPTALGEVVTDKLVEHFPRVMDLKFTSHMENELDLIEDAHQDWVSVLHEFYDPFRELLSQAGQAMEPARAVPSEHKCPECQAEMVYRWSKTGRFLACSRYPKCRATMNVDREGKPVVPTTTGHACEQCGRPMILRQSRRGVFLGCSGYPECRHTVPCNEQGEPLRLVKEEELQRPCEACGQGTMIVKRKGRRSFLGCNRYPECKQTASLPADVRLERKPAPPPEPAGINCERCGKPMVIRMGSRGRFVACPGYPKCRNTKPFEKLEELRTAALAAGTGTAVTPAGAESSAAGASGFVPGGEGALEIGAGKSKRSARKRSGGPAGGGAGAQDTAAAIGSAGSQGGNGSGGGMSRGEAHPEHGVPPAGFAWTRTGRPVVETMPAPGTLHCPQCGSTMELKRGRFGPFFSCSNFPRCRFNANLRGEAKKQAEEMMPAPERPKAIPTDIPCEACGSPMVIRHGRRGRFLGCSNYPKCTGTQELPPGFDVEKAEAAAAEAAAAR